MAKKVKRKDLAKIKAKSIKRATKVVQVTPVKPRKKRVLTGMSDTTLKRRLRKLRSVGLDYWSLASVKELFTIVGPYDADTYIDELVLARDIYLSGERDIPVGRRIWRKSQSPKISKAMRQFEAKLDKKHVLVNSDRGVWHGCYH